jgi:hypothetical protein
MVIHGIFNTISGTFALNIIEHSSLNWLFDGISQSTFLAQQVDVDIWKNAQQAWNNFVKTGQIWASIIGFILGWMIRDILP